MVRCVLRLSRICKLRTPRAFRKSLPGLCLCFCLCRCLSLPAQRVLSAATYLEQNIISEDFFLLPFFHMPVCSYDLCLHRMLRQRQVCVAWAHETQKKRIFRSIQGSICCQQNKQSSIRNFSESENVVRLKFFRISKVAPFSFELSSNHSKVTCICMLEIEHRFLSFPLPWKRHMPADAYACEWQQNGLCQLAGSHVGASGRIPIPTTIPISIPILIPLPIPSAVVDRCAGNPIFSHAALPCPLPGSVCLSLQPVAAAAAGVAAPALSAFCSSAVTAFNCACSRLLSSTPPALADKPQSGPKSIARTW